MSNKAKYTYDIVDIATGEVLSEGMSFSAARAEKKGNATVKVVKRVNPVEHPLFIEDAQPETEGTPDEFDQELTVEGDGPALGEDLTPDVEPEDAEAEQEEDGPQLPERPEGVADQDWRIFVKRHHGVTWRACAEAEGWAWHRTNMDGGRAARAVRRVKKALVRAELAAAKDAA